MNKRFLVDGTKKALVYIIALTLCFPALSVSAFADSEDTSPPSISENDVSAGGEATVNGVTGAPGTSPGQSSDTTDKTDGTANGSGETTGAVTDGGIKSPDGTTDDGSGSPDSATDDGTKSPDGTTDGGSGSPDSTTDGGAKSPDGTTDGGTGSPNGSTDGVAVAPVTPPAGDLFEEIEEEEVGTTEIIVATMASVNFKLGTELADDEKYTPLEADKSVEFELVLSGGSEYAILLKADTTTAVDLPDGEYSLKAGTFAPFGYKIDDGISALKFYVSDGVAFNSGGSPLTNAIDVYYTRSGKQLFSIELACEFIITKDDGGLDRSSLDEEGLADDSDTGLISDDDSLSGETGDSAGSSEGTVATESPGNESSGSETDQESASGSPASTDDSTAGTTDSGNPVNTDDSSSAPVVKNDNDTADTSDEDSRSDEGTSGEGGSGSASERTASPSAGSGVIPMDELYKDLISNDLNR